MKILESLLRLVIVIVIIIVFFSQFQQKNTNLFLFLAHSDQHVGMNFKSLITENEEKKVIFINKFSFRFFGVVVPFSTHFF